MKIVKFIFALLFGLMFINAGLDKFFHYNPMPKLTPEQMKVYAAFGEIGWLMPLVGAVEVIGGVLFIFPKTKQGLLIFTNSDRGGSIYENLVKHYLGDNGKKIFDIETK